jgi:hypothetical protein
VSENLRRAVVLERLKQISRRHDPIHDDAHVDGELATAAACYALPEHLRAPDPIAPGDWPWDAESWHPTPEDRKREIVKAVALLEAEYLRLERAEAREMYT